MGVSIEYSVIEDKLHRDGQYNIPYVAIVPWGRELAAAAEMLDRDLNGQVTKMYGSIDAFKRALLSITIEDAPESVLDSIRMAYEYGDAADLAQRALQGLVVERFTPIINAMKANALPLPENISAKAYESSLNALFEKEHFKTSRFAGTQSCNINVAKTKRSIANSIAANAWYLEAVFVAVCFAALSVTSTTPMGWALWGAVFLTVAIDKWSSGESKAELIANKFDRMRKGYYDDRQNPNAVRETNVWTNRAAFALSCFALVAGSFYIQGAKGLTSGVNAFGSILGTFYAGSAMLFTGSSLYLSMGKFIERHNMPLWFTKVKQADQDTLDLIADCNSTAPGYFKADPNQKSSEWEEMWQSAPSITWACSAAGCAGKYERKVEPTFEAMQSKEEKPKGKSCMSLGSCF